MKLTKNAGEEVLPLIGRAERELTVYSPFISPEYAKALVEKSEDGADVTVFTAEPDASYHRRSLQILQGGSKLPRTMRNAGLALVFLGVVGLLIAWSLELLALIPSVLSLAGGGYLLKRHSERADGWSESRGKMNINIVQNLHAKVYSRDNGEEVIFGSANLTNGGMRRNLEVVGECRNKPPPRESEPDRMYA